MTPQKQRHLFLSIALTTLTLFFAFIYFKPTQRKKTTTTLQKKEASKIDYDSLLTEILKDTNSLFRKTYDSIYSGYLLKFNEQSNKIANPELKKTSFITTKQIPIKLIKKNKADTVKSKPSQN